MSIYADYTTLTDLRGSYLGTSATGQDTLLLDLIRATSRDIDAAVDRRFYPRVETLTYDTPRGSCLTLDESLLSIATLTNGDGSVIAASEYNLYPLNRWPKSEIKLKPSAGVAWLSDLTGSGDGAISVLGVWGWHMAYTHAWPATGATLAAAITDAAATTFTCTTGLIRAGDLLKIDGEYLYASSVSVSTSDTVTAVRGVNGSTAATHLIAAPVYRWWQPEIALLCIEAVVAKFRLKNNPVGETVRVGEYSFSTARDVNAYIFTRLKVLGLVRVS